VSRFPLGVVYITFGALPLVEAGARARELGFDHIDAPAAWQGELPLPIGDRISSGAPLAGCSCPSLPPGEGNWERMVRAYRRTPGAILEPWAGSIVGSIEAVRAMLDEVPSLRLLVDTGHVACWGEDPVELLPFAAHVQLRQAHKGVNQALEGDVDFARVIARLDELDYGGLLSIEYFDLPAMGWPLDDPVGHAVALAAQIRRLLA
jgi:hypothetical protein